MQVSKFSIGKMITQRKMNTCGNKKYESTMKLNNVHTYVAMSFLSQGQVSHGHECVAGVMYKVA